MAHPVALLAVPSAVILALLVLHSLRALPRRRAAAFWLAVAAYGVARGLALALVIDRGLGATFPYVMHDPILPLLGVPLQEVAGWGIVLYIGWWLGCRFSDALFAQVAWGCLCVGAIGWAVESAAVAAGWWHWTVPASVRLLVNVPLIGLIDWFFAGIDFLLPFVALTARQMKGRGARYLTLLAFPAHFGAHCFVERLAGSVPIPFYHLAHWALAAALLWLATRSSLPDPAFAGASGRRDASLPLAALGVILLDAAAVDLLGARRPELLVSLLPAMGVALLALRPAAGYAFGGAALLLGAWHPPFVVSAVPAGAAALIGWGRRRAGWAPAAALLLLAGAAYGVHAVGARREAGLIRRLDAALAARDRGDLEEATAALKAAGDEFPGSHVPRALLGEIYYRTGRLEEARRLFVSAAEIQQDDAAALRHLAVIDIRSGRKHSAARHAEAGLRIRPGDPELRYLLMRCNGPEAGGILPLAAALDARRLQSLASLAFEVDDVATATALVERGLGLWPEERWFYRTRISLALSAGDAEAARRFAALWKDRLPGDAEARDMARRLGLE